MRTGKQHINYAAYAVIWAGKILAGVRGYSLDKARQISPMFASMVEYNMKLITIPYEANKRMAVMGGYLSELTKAWVESIKNFTAILQKKDSLLTADMEHYKQKDSNWTGKVLESCYRNYFDNFVMMVRELNGAYTDEMKQRFPLYAPAFDRLNNNTNEIWDKYKKKLSDLVFYSKMMEDLPQLKSTTNENTTKAALIVIVLGIDKQMEVIREESQMTLNCFGNEIVEITKKYEDMLN